MPATQKIGLAARGSALYFGTDIKTNGTFTDRIIVNATGGANTGDIEFKGGDLVVHGNPIHDVGMPEFKNDATTSEMVMRQKTLGVPWISHSKSVYWPADIEGEDIPHPGDAYYEMDKGYFAACTNVDGSFANGFVFSHVTNHPPGARGFPNTVFVENPILYNGSGDVANGWEMKNWEEWDNLAGGYENQIMTCRLQNGYIVFRAKIKGVDALMTVFRRNNTPEDHRNFYRVAIHGMAMGRAKDSF